MSSVLDIYYMKPRPSWGLNWVDTERNRPADVIRNNLLVAGEAPAGRSPTVGVDGLEPPTPAL